MILYSLRTAPFGYTITKFDDDFNVEASYDLSTIGSTCTCPAGARPSCRHRKMLPRMLDRADTDWFYHYESNIWHKFTPDAPASTVEAPPEPEPAPTTIPSLEPIRRRI